MSVLVSHQGTYKEATGMWCSLGGQWLEVSVGGGEPPSSAAIARLTANLDATLTAEWVNAVVLVPAPVSYEVLLGATTDPLVLPSEWVVVHTEPFQATPLLKYAWTGADPGANPGSYTYAMVVAAGADGSRSSPTYTNPVLADPLPTAPISFIGAWTSLEENTLIWEPPTELDAMTEYVLHYSSTGPIASAGEGTFLDTIPRGIEAYVHTKATAEQEIQLWYSLFCRRADGLTGPHAAWTVRKGEVPPPGLFSAIATSHNAIALSWNDPIYFGDATGYRLVFKQGAWPTGVDDPTATVLLDNAPFSTNLFNHTGLTPATTYYYVIACNQPSGYGVDAVDSATTRTTPPPVPGAVINYDLTPGLMWCWFWVSWGSPTNTSEISSYDIRAQANTAPGGGGTHARTVFHQDGVTSYVRFLYETEVTAPTMGISTNATNSAGAGPWANGTSTLGGFAQSLCTYTHREPGLYYPKPGRFENLEPVWVENFYRATGRPMPREINEAWYTVTWLLEEDYGDYEGWWCRVLMALEVALWMDKPSKKAWDRANGVLLSPRDYDILYYWDAQLPRVVNERNSDTGVLALTECMSALGTSW